VAFDGVDNFDKLLKTIDICGIIKTGNVKIKSVVFIEVTYKNHLTENPCVPGSIPGGATNKNKDLRCFFKSFLFFRIDYNFTTIPN